MSQRPIPTSWDDLELWLLNEGGREFAGVPVRNEKPADSGAYRRLVIQADLQNRVTAISRYARIMVSSWDVTAAGQVNIGRARTTLTDYCTHLETICNTMSTAGPFLSLVTDSTARLNDKTTGRDYIFASLLAEVHAR